MLRVVSEKWLTESFRACLHQASATTLRQLCDDANNTVLIENNGVTRKWVATPFWSDSIVTACKQSLRQGSIFTSVCLSTGGLCMLSLPVWLPGPTFLPGGLCRYMPPPPRIRKVRSTYPTGMPSCFK